MRQIKKLELTAIKMSESIMQDLEDKELVMRLTPSKAAHRMAVEKGKGKGGYLYKSDDKYGAHSLVNVAIDNPAFSSFATHPDNEEVFLLGGIGEKTLYLLVSFLTADELNKRQERGTLAPSDFVCLECVFNDPYLSFFVMLKGVPHGECAAGNGLPATFYCTESACLPLDKIDLDNGYNVIVT